MATPQNYWVAPSYMISDADNSASPEESIGTDDNTLVVVGLAARVREHNVIKVAIQVAPLTLDANGNTTLDTNQVSWLTSDGNPYDPKQYEQSGCVPLGQVLVGAGFSVRDSNVRTLALYSREWIGTTVANKVPAMGADVTTTWIPKQDTLERSVSASDQNSLVVGVSMSCRGNNASGLWLNIAAIDYADVPPPPPPPTPANPPGTEQAHGCIQWSSIEGFYAFFSYAVGGTCPDGSEMPDYSLGSKPNIPNLADMLGQPGTLTFKDLTKDFPDYPSTSMRGKPATAVSFVLDS